MMAEHLMRAAALPTRLSLDSVTVDGPRAFDWLVRLLSVAQTGFHCSTIVELGASQAIRQSKILSHLQGADSDRAEPRRRWDPGRRVLADRVFEASATGTSALTQVLVPLAGRGPGAGMSPMFVLLGHWLRLAADPRDRTDRSQRIPRSSVPSYHVTRKPNVSEVTPTPRTYSVPMLNFMLGVNSIDMSNVNSPTSNK